MKEIKTFEEAKAAVNAFEKYMSSRSRFGACDTEPRGMLCYVMRNALHRNKDIELLFEGDNPWELYSSMRGWKAVSDCLTRKVKELVRQLREAPYKNVCQLVEYYGWNY